MSDTADQATPGPLTLALRAVFVPDGEEPPPEFAATLTPLRFRATLDPETGVLTTETAGTGLMDDIRAEWRPSPGAAAFRDSAFQDSESQDSASQAGAPQEDDPEAGMEDAGPAEED